MTKTWKSIGVNIGLHIANNSSKQEKVSDPSVLIYRSLRVLFLVRVVSFLLCLHQEHQDEVSLSARTAYFHICT